MEINKNIKFLSMDDGGTLTYFGENNITSADTKVVTYMHAPTKAPTEKKSPYTAFPSEAAASIPVNTS